MSNAQNPGTEWITFNGARMRASIVTGHSLRLGDIPTITLFVSRSVSPAGRFFEKICDPKAAITRYNELRAALGDPAEKDEDTLPLEGKVDVPARDAIVMFQGGVPVSVDLNGETDVPDVVECIRDLGFSVTLSDDPHEGPTGDPDLRSVVTCKRL